MPRDSENAVRIATRASRTIVIYAFLCGGAVCLLYLAPSLFMMQRAEESMRHLYDLLTSEESRAFIEEHSEENPVWAALGESLDAHQLPPFETLIQYFGPGGGILYDTDNGYHAISFTLRSEAAP